MKKVIGLSFILAVTGLCAVPEAQAQRLIVHPVHPVPVFRPVVSHTVVAVHRVRRPVRVVHYHRRAVPVHYGLRHPAYVRPGVFIRVR